MTRSLTKKFTYSLLSLCLVLGSASSRADDTEIYFESGNITGNTGEVIRPNILFVLDTSTSMDDPVPEAGGAERIDVLKQAVKTIINNVQDVNIGIMRYTSGEGGPVLFPITYVDEDLGNVVGESSAAGSIYYTNTINGGDNDAEENLNTNVVSLSDDDLEVKQLDPTIAITTNTVTITKSIDADNRDAEEVISSGNVSTGSNTLDFIPSQLVGLVFNNIDIPANSVITRAYLELYVDTTPKTTTTNIVIYGMNDDDPADFTATKGDISSRNVAGTTRTSASVNWNGVDTGVKSGSGYFTYYKITSIDFKDIIQEIVHRNCTYDPATTPDATGCTYGGDHLGLVFETTKGERSIQSHDKKFSIPPRLTVEYETPKTVATPGDDNLVGLRFDNVRIPRHAKVTSASLVFTPSDDSSDDSTWTIQAEDIGNSPEFQNVSKNLTGRTLTSDKLVWIAPPFTTGDSVATTDTASSDKLLTVVQNLVDRADWCGGNAMSFFITEATNMPDGLRKFFSQDGSSADAPRFKYSFTGGTGDCYISQQNGQVAVSGDDAQEDSGTGEVSLIGTHLDLGTATVGVRFQNVKVPPDAVITDARLIFYAKGTSTGAASFTVKGELPADGDADLFDNAINNITDVSVRPKTAGVTWTPSDWVTDGEQYSSDDLSSIVQDMVKSANNWASGNAMAFMIEPSSGTRIAESNNGDPARGARLQISYEDSTSSQVKTVRERLSEIIDDLPASGSTPITEVMYEAALYWRGQNVDYGLNRNSSKTSRISHPGSYCLKKKDGTLDCRGATVGTGDGDPDPDIYGVKKSDSCDMVNNPNGTYCASQAIQGKPTYISPFNSELTCQNNYQVLLTDGSANNSGSTVRSNIEKMTGKTSCFSNNSTFKRTTDIAHDYGSDEKCTVDLMKYLKENDQSTASIGDNLANDQTVKTYTIGFNLGSKAADDIQFLTDMANVGGGKYYDATTAGTLVDVFTSILTDVKSDPTSFVSPSLATNAFNRLLSRDEVYFGLFTPQLNKAWPGNIKKYKVCIDTSTGCSLGEILDATGVAAIDPANDKFKDTAQSIWSSGVDGKATTVGGSGAEITDYTKTVIYTEVNDSATATSGEPLSDTGFNLTSANWDDGDHGLIRSKICPTVSTAAGSDCENRVLWLLGKLIVPDTEHTPTTDISATQRWSTNDVLHSSPAVITYGGLDDNTNGVPDEPADKDGVISTFFDKIVVGTNDGALHMINGYDGTEDWRFIPNEFLNPTQRDLFRNPESTHPYGLDVTPTILSVDNNSNGKIETANGDYVHIFVASRRGGKSIYALDVTADVTSKTQKVVPKYLWRIQGGVTSGYSRLGYTWSQPRLATINAYNGTNVVKKKVLIFGGGYDNTQDTAGTFSPADNGGADFRGNAIFITDPTDGSKILSISGAGTGADIEVSDMGYSIPSRITIADSNGDGVGDRLYVGDTGGQVWRVDLGNDIKTAGGLRTFADCSADSACFGTVIGKLASVSDTADGTQHRRFFEPPSVVQVSDATYSSTSDYDYVLIGSGYRAHPLNTEVHDRFYAFRDRYISGLADADGDHLSEVADGYADGSGGPIIGTGDAPSDNNLINVTSSILDTSAATKGADGWYYDFNEAGNNAEKVLSAANTVSGGVTFTTFRPGVSASSNPCEGTLGNANAYNFNILNANAFLDWDGDGDIDTDDRTQELGGGIPSDVVPVFTEEGVVGLVGIEGGASQLGVLAGLPRFRTYWYEDM